jgi:TonB family protein
MMLHAEDRATPKAPVVRVSTGVVAPKLIKTVNVQKDTVSVVKPANGEYSAVVALLVDETGKPTNLKILQSAGEATLDQNVLSAVEKYRWTPGSVSGQIVAVPVNLKVVIEQKAE